MTTNIVEAITLARNPRINWRGNSICEIIKETRSSPTTLARAMIRGLVETVNAKEETQYQINVEEQLWDIKGDGNSPEDMKLLAVFNFHTNNFELPSKWVRDGSKFLGKGPMGIKDALVNLMNLCGDCNNIAGLMDLSDMGLDEAIDKMIADNFLSSTECDYCESWITSIIAKKIFNPFPKLKYFINGVYRTCRRFYISINPEVQEGEDNKKIIAIIEALIFSIFGRVQVNIFYGIDDDIRRQTHNVDKDINIEGKELTQIWPRWLTDWAEQGIPETKEKLEIPDDQSTDKSKDKIERKIDLNEEINREEIVEALRKKEYPDLADMITVISTRIK